MRRPLDALVEATRDLAAGELERIEEERHRLAVTVESLGDALIVTEPGATTIATINPRAAELVPELIVGARPTRRTARCRRSGGAARGDDDRASRSGAGGDRRPLGAEADGVVWTVRDMSERARLERAKTSSWRWPRTSSAAR